MQIIDVKQDYAVSGYDMERVRAAALRLFSETRFQNGDEMRDLAQSLQVVVDRAFPVGE